MKQSLKHRCIQSLSLTSITLSVVLALPGCGGGEEQTTGMVVHDDPDAALRTKEMEDYMAKQASSSRRR